MRSTSLVASLGLIAGVLAHPLSDNEKRYGVHSYPDRAKAVKKAFETSWNGYFKNAFPNDNLHPISNTFDNDRYNWGVTAVDSLDTAIIMGEKKIVKKILDHIATIDYTTTKEKGQVLSVFETNIRYLGGMISAYDLLKGDYKHLVNDHKKVDVLLKQSVVLADSLSVAFDTPSGVPDPQIVLNPKHRVNGSSETDLADAGTLVLEWTRLSDLTGDKKYAKLAQKAQSYFLKPEPASSEPWPGLVGTFINIENGTFKDSNGGWSGLTDSFYEYLIKMYLYDPEEFGKYKDRWVLAADSSMEHLASHPTGHKDLTYLSQYNGKNPIPVSSNLASFAGGNFILAGTVLGEDKYTEFGKELAKSYIHTYAPTATHIGPESFGWVASELPANGTNNSPPPVEQADFYKKNGYYVTTPNYILRPETIESVWYAYRITGDAMWNDLAWDAFQAIVEKTRAGSAFSGIKNVTEADGGGFDDSMESFWLAEVLKYFYLLFDAEAKVQFQADTPNKYVFNTEAHPFLIRAAGGGYGDGGYGKQ